MIFYSSSTLLFKPQEVICHPRRMPASARADETNCVATNVPWRRDCSGVAFFICLFCLLRNGRLVLLNHVFQLSLVVTRTALSQQCHQAQLRAFGFVLVIAFVGPLLPGCFKLNFDLNRPEFNLELVRVKL